MVDLLKAHPWLAAGVGVGSFLGTLGISAVVVVRIPHDYFVGDEVHSLLPLRSPWLRWLARIGRNLVGVTLIVLGLLMSVPGIPGQGLLTILLGVMMVDLPRKRRLERWIVGRPSVLRTMNRLRARYGRPPLTLSP